jgi:hypothetical protein
LLEDVAAVEVALEVSGRPLHGGVD